MEIEQLELDLWQSLETAVRFPQTADLSKLCDALEWELVEHPVAEQLQIAADVLVQLSQLYAARVELLISGWESRYNPTEPVVDLEGCVELFVQSLHLDVADLFEPLEPVQYPAHRQSRTTAEPNNSLVGQVDKAVLLEVVERLSEEDLLTETNVREQLQQLAGEENVEKWQQVIAQWIERSCASEAVSLKQLQQALGMPMVEVWLALLLARQDEYELEQRGDFYSPRGIWVRNRRTATVV